MHIAILGTGALGSVYAAYLAPFVDITMLGTWPDGLAALALHGIRLTLPDGSTRRQPVVVAGSPDGVPAADVVLVLVKSYQTPRAAEWAAQLLAPTGIAITLQNGLDNASRLTARIGDDCVSAGVTYNGATLTAPGQVRHAALQPTYIAPPRGHGSPVYRAQFDALLALLMRAGLPAGVEPNIAGRLWGKAIANAAINPLTALWRVPNGALLDSPARVRLLAALAAEAADVAAALNVAVPFTDPLEYVQDVCRATAGNRSSMLQDVERGRRTEIDSINGIVVQEARRLSVPAPHNELVWQLVGAL